MFGVCKKHKFFAIVNFRKLKIFDAHKTVGFVAVKIHGIFTCLQIKATKIFDFCAPNPSDLRDLQTFSFTNIKIFYKKYLKTVLKVIFLCHN